MQRFATLLAVLTPITAAAQVSAARALWRVAATTLPVPQALATGGSSALWIPAQPPLAGGASVSLELVQSPEAISVVGALIVARLSAGPVGQVGLVYGDMSVSDLVRTSTSPIPDEGTIPYGSRLLGVNWSATRNTTTVGATVGIEDTRLDAIGDTRGILDLGIRQALPGAIHLALATHLLSRFASDDPGADLHGGIEWRAWQGAPWRGSGPVALSLRYGTAVARRSTPDHDFGVGVRTGDGLALDVLISREGSYGGGAASWRGSAGLRVGLGRYHVAYARDTGADELGSAYRVGLEVQSR